VGGHPHHVGTGVAGPLEVLNGPDTWHQQDGDLRVAGLLAGAAISVISSVWLNP